MNIEQLDDARFTLDGWILILEKLRNKYGGGAILQVEMRHDTVMFELSTHTTEGEGDAMVSTPISEEKTFLIKVAGRIVERIALTAPEAAKSACKEHIADNALIKVTVGVIEVPEDLQWMSVGMVRTWEMQ